MSQWHVTFGPETIPVLTAAFEKAWESFLHSEDRRMENRDKARHELAACVIDASQSGERDSSRLARQALAKLRQRELGHGAQN